MKKQVFFFALISVMIFFACEQNSSEILDQSVELKECTNIQENCLTINWEASSTDYDQLIIEISTSEVFNTPEQTVVVTEKNQNSQVIEGLKGMTNYFYRIRLEKSGIVSASSKIASTSTSCAKTSVDLVTNDGYSLRGSIYYLDNGKEKKPGLLFMHEYYYATTEQRIHGEVLGWENSQIFKDLISDDYVCMYFNFRGHGISDQFDIYTVPFTEYTQEFNADMLSALNFIKNHGRVYKDSIGLVGAELGARMAVLGSCLDGVKLTVAVSYHNVSPINYNCSNNKPDNILIIAGENEFITYFELELVDWVAQAQQLYNSCQEPKKKYIEPEAEEHGTNLLGHPDVNTEIRNWVITYL